MIATMPSAPSQDMEQRALKWGAQAVMVAHNHPSGDLEPSNADLDFTRRLIELGEIAQIRLLDHLIIATSNNTSKSYCSIREMRPEAFRKSAACASHGKVNEDKFH